MKNAQRSQQRATRPALTLETTTPVGCTPTPEDAPHYLELAHTVRTSSKLSGRLYDYAEWEITRRRSGVPSLTEEGYSIDIQLRFGHGSAQRPDVIVQVCSIEAEGPDGLSTGDFRRLVAALNTAAATLPAEAPGLLLPEAAS